MGEQEDYAEDEWLRAAAREGFDALDRGDYIVVNSEEQLDAFFREIREQVMTELRAELKLG